jgi:IS605 OrfB family transposase
LNQAKWEAVCELARRYANEKQAHLAYFTDEHFAASPDKERTRRDELVAVGYLNPHGLQARQWKMAEKEAYETVHKQWAALAEELRPRIAAHKGWTEDARHYAMWLLKDARRLAALMSGRAPVPEHFGVAASEQKTVRNYLRRVIRRRRGAHPTVRIARSFALDDNMYTVFEQNGAQYIAVMSLQPRQRVVIPLTGQTPIAGNTRVVLDFARRRVEIHYTAEVKPPVPLTGEPCALDAGVSEVFTDEDGTRYVPEFGPFLAQASEALLKKGRRRNRLHQIAKQAAAKGDAAKAHRIRKFNLGRKKLRARARRQRAEMERLINTAVNQVVTKRQPSTVVTEKLDIRGKARSKKISRRVSLWARRILKDRTEFKASAEGFRREQVNPAYSSQTCPVDTCGFVHSGNRRGDAFQCLHCGHADRADRVAATNLKARGFDPEITLFTPKEWVKEILLARFNARLAVRPLVEDPLPGTDRSQVERDSTNVPTVAGRTPGASQEVRRRAKRPTQSRSARENVGAKSG